MNTDLTDKLRAFGEIRAKFKEAEAYAKQLEGPYRALMAEVVDDLTEVGLLSVNVAGFGTFNLRSTLYSRVVNMPHLLHFVEEEGLTNLPIVWDHDQVTITLVRDSKEGIVEGAKTSIETLVNGQVNLDVNKSVLNSLMEEYEGSIPGVTQFSTKYITVYEKKK